jgi:hypothetical protein
MAMLSWPTPTVVDEMVSYGVWRPDWESMRLALEWHERRGRVVLAIQRQGNESYTAIVADPA